MDDKGELEFDMFIDRVKSLTKSLAMWFYAYHCNDKAVILTAADTVNYVVKHRCSLIRFGDGEFYLMGGSSIHYQEFSEAIKNDLALILKSDSEVCSNILICMPKFYFECSGLELLKKRVLFRSWVKPRYMFKKHYDEKRIYGDAFLFAEKNNEVYKLIWEGTDVKTVLFVHNNPLYASFFKEKYGKEIHFIRVPSNNAYACVDDIYNNIVKFIESNKVDIVLISAGPCAKVLVFRLAKRGVWAIDTGHCWDDPIV